MFQLLNKIYLFLITIVLLSCSFIDLRPIGIEIKPDEINSLLPEQFSPIIIRFNTEMIKNDAEGILQINSDLGAIKGDKLWKGTDLYFIPVQGWTAGIRYTLSLMGTIRSVDGRELRLDRYIPFYAINKKAPPVIEWFSPSNGESVGTNNLIFEFHFSQPMDRFSVESALILEGIGNKTYVWSGDDRILSVIPEKPLSPWIAYRWNLKESAKCINGVPVPRSYSGHFTTDIDQVLPYVTNVFPVVSSNGNWFPTGASIETGLGPGQGIGITFNKSMGDNTLRSIRFEPSLTGRTEFLSENSIVYIFTRNPEPQTIYTLIVSAESRDTEGLKTGADFKLHFMPDIPYLKVISLAAGNDFFNIDLINNTALPIHIDKGTGEFNFSIHFSLPFNFEEKHNTPQRIVLSPFFPRSSAPIALNYVNWFSDDRLSMRWEGLTSADNDVIQFYKLTIPGGRGGISSETGIFMKEDVVIYLEVIK